MYVDVREYKIDALGGDLNGEASDNYEADGV